VNTTARFRFIEETLELDRVGCDIGMQDFERDIAIDELVLCSPNGSARAGAKHADETVARLEQITRIQSRSARG
jgi:hypothetical protein